LLKKSYKIADEIVNIKYNKYLETSNVYLPLKNYDELYLIYKNNKSKKITESNKFFISKVVNGKLDIIKEV
jgi:hypothetical protein